MNCVYIWKVAYYACGCVSERQQMIHTLFQRNTLSTVEWNLADDVCIHEWNFIGKYFHCLGICVCVCRFEIVHISVFGFCTLAKPIC